VRWQQVAETLVAKYPSRLAFARDVNADGVARDVLTISTLGLSEDESESFAKEISRAFDNGLRMIVPANSNHAIFAFGETTHEILTHQQKLKEGTYRAPRGARVEPIVAREESPYAIKDVQTHAKLNDNGLNNHLPHNCTSWLFTAPIGEHGEPLHQLVGMTADDLANEKAGFATGAHAYLVREAPSHRVPLVLLWTAEPIQESPGSIVS
jgi:hypothetical protein